MRGRLKDNPYYKWGETAFFVGVLLITFYHLLTHFSGFQSYLGTIRVILSPFVYGLVMAYLVCPIYNLVVGKSYPLLKKKFKPRRALSIARIVGSTVALIVMIGSIIGFLALLVPQLVQSAIELFGGLPERMQVAALWAKGLTQNIKEPLVAKAVDAAVTRGQETLITWSEQTFLPSLGEYVNLISQGLLVTLKSIMDLIIGFIVAVYFLNSKEIFKAQSKKIILASTSPNVSKEIMDFAEFTNKTFGGFINGKIIDSIIIGIICFFAMWAIGLPYPVLISTIIGVTNIIPFFGPFIGALPCTFIIVLVSPLQALYFVLMIFILQQLDGNVIGPAILGGSTGLASFWVMFAIIVGGGIFGFIGMVIGVPVFAIIYYYVGRATRSRLKKKELPQATTDYINFDQYKIDKKDII